jgi:hypothetical protein
VAGPAGQYAASRRYLDRTVVLETTFRTPSGVTARGGAEWLVLSSPAGMRLAASTATAQLTLRAGQTAPEYLHMIRLII